VRRVGKRGDIIVGVSVWFEVDLVGVVGAGEPG